MQYLQELIMKITFINSGLLAASLTVLLVGSSCARGTDANKPIAPLTAPELLQVLPKADDVASVADAKTTPPIAKIDDAAIKKETVEAAKPKPAVIENVPQKNVVTTPKVEEKKVTIPAPISVPKKKVEPPVPATPSVPTAQANSEESPVVKIVLKNLDMLAGLTKDKLNALHATKVVPLTEIEKNLKNSDEDHFCQVAVTGNLAAGEKMALDRNDRKQIDKEFDLFISELEFKNAKGSLLFSCHHTTPNFFIEDFAINFAAYLDVVMPDGKLIKTAGYVNEKTLKRHLHAIRIKDPQKLEKLVLSDKGTSQAIVKQEILDATDAVALVETEKAKMACVIDDKSGEFDPKLTYIAVEKGVAKETAKAIPTGTVYIMYRASDTHFFQFLCVTRKDTSWFELMDTAKGTLEFGVLSRLEYNKKYDEVKALHTQLQATKPK